MDKDHEGSQRGEPIFLKMVFAFDEGLLINEEAFFLRRKY
jgi:hypothetical protein